MNKYQEALKRISSINLDRILERLGYEEATKISDYGINDYPNLEMQSDIETLRELIDEATPKKANPLFIPMVFTPYRCPCCNTLVNSKKDRFNYCPNCGQRIDWSDKE